MTYVWDPPRQEKSKTVLKLRLIYFPELKRNGENLGRVKPVSQEEDNSQEHVQSTYWVNRCVSCHAVESYRPKNISLVITFFLAQGPYVNCFRLLRKK